MIASASYFPLEVFTTPFLMEFTCTPNSIEWTRAASASEKTLMPCAGNPEFPVTKCPIAVRPYSALTNNGSARKTPVRKGLSTRSYVLPTPLTLSSSPTLATRVRLIKYLTKQIFSISEPVSELNMEKNATRGSPIRMRFSSRATSIIDEAETKSISFVIPNLLISG